MAAAAKAYGGPSGENMKVIKIFASGKLVAEVHLKKDAFDASAAQDKTDINVHISSTLTGLTMGTLTTIS